MKSPGLNCHFGPGKKKVLAFQFIKFGKNESNLVGFINFFILIMVYKKKSEKLSQHILKRKRKTV